MMESSALNRDRLPAIVAVASWGKVCSPCSGTPDQSRHRQRAPDCAAFRLVSVDQATAAINQANSVSVER